MDACPCEFESHPGHQDLDGFSVEFPSFFLNNLLVMTTVLTINDEISKYWSYIKNANDEIKLKLISLLSLSLSNKEFEIDNLESEEERTQKFLKKYSGAWVGNETAEEIIEIIKSVNSCKEPPLFD